jgi:hypothetical protein
MKLKIIHCEIGQSRPVSKAISILSKLLSISIAEAKELYLSFGDETKDVWMEEEHIHFLLADGWYLYSKHLEQIQEEKERQREEEESALAYDEAKQWYESLDEKTKSYVDILNRPLVAIG